MAAPMEKISRKISRAVAILQENEPTVLMSREPTNVLFLSNGGIVSGCEYDTLESMCVESVPHGSFEIYMYPDKSYSFISFSSTQGASDVLNRWQGKACRPKGNVIILCFLYVTKVPIRHKEVDENFVQPRGLTLLENFITASEEQRLLGLIDYQTDGIRMNNRTVVHFGYDFLYSTNEPDLSRPSERPIPDLCEALAKRLVHLKLMSDMPNQLTVNVYEPGQGIPSHADSSYLIGKEICSLSLCSGVLMNFKKFESPHRYSLWLPQRSLLVMSDQCRYVWKHGITPRKYDLMPSGKVVKRLFRMSFTFRYVGGEHRTVGHDVVGSGVSEMDLRFMGFQNFPRGIEISNEELEEKFVYNVYDSIAADFDRSRYSLWPGVRRFLDKLPPYSFLLDVGCGNGKYLSYRPDLIKMGCDRSVELCALCAKKGYDVFQTDCFGISVPDGRFDAVLCIAVIHHFPSEARRLLALQEILRVLKTGGQALVYVWAMEQSRDGRDSAYLKSGGSRKDRPSSDMMNPEPAFPLPVHKRGHLFEASDIFVPWALKEGKLSAPWLRYYHVFEDGELENLCRKLDECSIVESFYENGNWCVVIEKSLTVMDASNPPEASPPESVEC